MELLKFITCGSVDDGKSTLIGRLLQDSQTLYDDQLEAIRSNTDEAPDLSLLVDGLQSEREQGITIDVAYRYFNTQKRKFIIADTPGHEQYTRNMATGASTSDLAVILIDASQGVQTQTKRHSYIVSLLGIKHAIVAINKIDLINYDQARYKAIQDDYLKLAGQLDIPDIHFVPISALNGDNVVHKSANTPWFRGRTLIEYLETLEINRDGDHSDFRFAVQYVNRVNTQATPNFRGYAGTIASGTVSKGDTIRVLPSGQISTISSIYTFDGELEQAQAPQAVTLTLNDQIDISRGDMIVEKNAMPHMSSRLRAKMVWLNEDGLVPYKEYYLKMGSKLTTCVVQNIRYRVDVNSLEEADAETLVLNEIGLVDMNVHERVVFDKYRINRSTGAFILIDKINNATVGAGMVHQPLTDQTTNPGEVSEFEKNLNAYVRKHFPHWNAKEV